ncbi:hypothetical protein GCM10009122_12250 [Fulvivirga kasyanovii]|uniref:nucleotidyl transferase AbiEii/AbiGii toxin family protein n=1 Tax=Fulvivirga kasyanovii TaxID=396812 RepID=UPI0031DE413A
MKGLSENTLAVLDTIQHYKELQGYFLVGGTALAIHLNHRLSEDLDLFQYNQFPGGKRFPLKNQNEILQKLKADFNEVEVSLSDKYNINLLVDGVKVQLYSENKFHRPKNFSGIGYISLPDEKTLIGMKLTALVLRKTWRDYYDLYSLVKAGFTELILGMGIIR